MPSLTRSLGVALGITILFVHGASAAGTSMDGLRGLLRVHSADPDTPGYLSGSIYGLYAREQYTVQQSPRNRTETVKFGGSSVGVSYSPSPYVQLAVRSAVESQFLTAAALGDQSESAYGVANVAFAVKSLLTPADKDRWMLGADVSVATSTGSNEALMGSWNPDGVDVAGRLNFTYANVQPGGNANLRLHMNAGYLARTGEFDQAAFDVTSAGGTPTRSTLHGNQFLYGAAVEVPARDWTLFAEWTGEFDTESGARFEDNPMRVTPGFRWTAPSGSFGWTTGVDVNVASEGTEPAWQLVSGITLGGYMQPVRGQLFGVVRDSETGEPIDDVEVTIRNSNELPAHSDLEGRFSTKIQEGYAVVELAAEGYNPKTRVVEVKGSEKMQLDFAMTKRNIFGSVQGRVRDSDTGEPLFARVRVSGTNDWVETDPSTGSFYIEQAPEGSVELEFEARKYKPTMLTAEVTAGEMTAQDASLARDLASTIGILTGYVHAAKSGENLAAQITARGKETLTTTVDQETGLFELELPEGTYSLSVTSPGHVAEVESIEIVEKEATVRNFDLDLLPNKMTLSGVFFDSGAATIKRDSYASLEEAAKFLKNNANLKVVIQGHTDSRGSLSGNITLSQRRADAVMKFLVVNYGLDPNRLQSEGVGPHEPIASNETSEGRALNRRIEFVLQDSKDNKKN